MTAAGPRTPPPGSPGRRRPVAAGPETPAVRRPGVRPPAPTPTPTPQPSADRAPRPGVHRRPRTARRRWALPVVLLVVAAAVAGVAGATSSAIRHQVALTFVRQPVSYDELYFDEPLALPTTARPGSVNRFTFVIVVHHSAGAVRRYAIAAPGTEGLPSAGTVSVRDNVPVNVVQAFTAPAPDQPYSVTVRLLPDGPRISFHGITS